MEVQRRCIGPCHRMLPNSEFRIMRRWTDNKGKHKLVRDVYCNTCAPGITVRQRRLDGQERGVQDR
jgi:hypothetical protein